MGFQKWLKTALKLSVVLIMLTLYVFPQDDLIAMQDQEQVAYKITSMDLQEKFYKTNINKQISVNIVDDTIEKALRQIADRTGLNLTYRGDIIENKRVTIRNQEIGVTDALDLILEGTELEYMFSNNGYLLVYKSEKEIADLQMQETVRGSVVDADTGDPIPGVNILIQGTETGTATNLDGQFVLTVPSLNETLIFSYISYERLEVQINGRTNIEVQLTPLVIRGGELVVVGYGTVQKSNLVGSVGSVQAENIQRQPTSRVDQALQGSSPGLVVQNNSAQPGGRTTIRIRGVNSITGANDPLVIIDGFIGGDLSSISPNDIESIEVLKDAASTAIYGSRGANGVILVNTKRGGAGRTTVQYSNYINFQSPSNKIDLMNAGQYARTVNDNRITFGLSPVFTSEQISAFDQTGGTDWQDEIFRNSIEQNHSLSISGGSENISYYLSGNINSNDGIVRGSSYERYSLRSNLESDISERFKIGLNLYLSQTESDSITTGSNQDQAITHAALVWAPTKDVYTAGGGYTLPGGGYGPPAVFNPLAMAVEPINERLANRTEVNTFIDYEIFDGLTARTSFGARIQNAADNFYYNTSPRGGVGNSEAGILDSRSSTFQNTNILTYQTMFSEEHDLNVTAVFEQQTSEFNSNFAGSNGFTTDALTYNNLALGENPQTPTSFKSKRQLLSYVGRVNYSFKGKYLFSVIGRYDGSSVFANEKWGFFPSAAVAWRVSSEPFMENFEQISDLKLRVSYGIVGSQAVSPYTTTSSLNTNAPYPIDGSNLSPGVRLGVLGNPDLKWETTSQFNTGLDLGILQDRIELTAEYYRKITSDLLFNLPLPRTSGYASVLRNIGEVQNQGVEFNLRGYPINRGLQWNTNLNFAVNRNKVLSLASGEDEAILGGVGFPNFGNTVYLQVGQPIGVLKGYIQDGIWGTDEEAEANSFGSIPGAPRYVDQNGDGVINSSDMVRMGNTLPKFTYGWNNTFNYKNLDLSILIQGAQGNDVYNLSRVRSERSSSDSDATSMRILDRWTPDNQDTDVPSFEGSSYENLQSSRWLEDGSYLRIKTLTLGYMLPETVLNRVGLRSVRFYASGSNLFTFTKYTGYDPESSTGLDAFGGIDIGSYPSQKMYTFGVNITF